MITSRQAFNTKTTIKCNLYIRIEGAWDSNNHWIDAGYEPAKSFRVTPIPAGNKSDANYAETLQARPELERDASYMKLHSRTYMPINSLVNVYGKYYKIIRMGDYSGASFHTAIAAMLHVELNDANQIVFTYTDETGKEIKESGRYL